MITAGIAATSPIAVASSASAIPGATTARLVVCAFEIPTKLFMMPHTVPNSRTNGDVAPMVASNPMPSRMRRASAREISAKLDAARSLMPLSEEMPADSRGWRIAAARNADNTPVLTPSANWASASERESVIAPSAEVSLRCATVSSIIFAIKIVQVTSDAKARPIITALTRTSADRKIDHGDNSRSATLVDFSGLLSAAAVVASGAEVDAAAVEGARGCPTGAAGAGLAAVCDGVGWEAACWADRGCAGISDITASAKAAAAAAPRKIVFIFRSSSRSYCNAGNRLVRAWRHARRVITTRRNRGANAPVPAADISRLAERVAGTRRGSGSYRRTRRRLRDGGAQQPEGSASKAARHPPARWPVP